MNLKALLDAAAAAADKAGDLAYEASDKADEANDFVRKLREFVEAAPKNAAEIIERCVPASCFKGVYLPFDNDHGHVTGRRYVFTRVELEQLVQDAFGAGACHGSSYNLVPAKSVRLHFSDGTALDV